MNTFPVLHLLIRHLNVRPLIEKRRNYWALTLLAFCHFSLLPFSLHGLLIYSIDSSYQKIPSGDPTEDPKGHSFPCLRILSYDTDPQKIIAISYYSSTQEKKTSCIEHPHFRVCYKPCGKKKLSLRITPHPQGEFWIVSYGTFLTNPHSIEPLSRWDRRLEKKAWSLYKGNTKGPNASKITTISPRVNHLNKEALSRKRHPTQKNPHWKKDCSESVPIFYNNILLPLSVFSLKKDIGDLGEIACDLLFLSFGLVKHEGKVNAIQGFDGIYSNPEETLFLLSETKWWKSCPPLDRIEGDFLRPKLDEKNNRAITKIEVTLKEKILMADKNRKLYLVPLGLFPNGQIYARLHLHHEDKNLSPLPRVFEKRPDEKFLWSLFETFKRLFKNFTMLFDQGVRNSIKEAASFLDH